MFYAGGLDGLDVRGAGRVPLHGRRRAGHGLGGDHRQRAQGRGAGRAVRDRQEHRRDRRLDQPRPPPDRADHAPASQRAAPVPRGRSLRRDPRVRHRPQRQGAAARPGARGRLQRQGPLVHAPRRGSDRDARRAGDARLAARHLFHLQPRRLRAGDGDGPRRGQAAPASGPAAAGGRRHSRGRLRHADDRRVAAQPDHLPGARDGRGPSPRGRAALGEAPDRAAVRARAVQGGLRHRDHVLGHPHAGQECRAPVTDQAHGPRLPLADPQRAHPDGGPGGTSRHRPRGQVRHGPRRPRRPRRHDPGRGRTARAGAEPVQAGLRIRRAAPGDWTGHGDDPAHGRVVVRAVPEPQEDPGPRGRGREPGDGRERRPALRGSVRRLLPHRPLPGRARPGRAAAHGPRQGRARRALGGQRRAGPPGARPAQERRLARR